MFGQVVQQCINGTPKGRAAEVEVGWGWNARNSHVHRGRNRVLRNENPIEWQVDHDRHGGKEGACEPKDLLKERARQRTAEARQQSPCSLATCLL